MTHSTNAKRFQISEKFDINTVMSSPIHLQQVVNRSNDKGIKGLKDLQAGQIQMTENQFGIRSIQYQLLIDNKKKSEETTKAAREVVKRLVASAERELCPTSEELSWLYMDLEREAKRNLVEKEMKVTRKMEERKTRQTKKWKDKFEKCMSTQKYWRMVKDRQYANIWPYKKKKQSSSTRSQSPRNSVGSPTQIKNEEQEHDSNLPVHQIEEADFNSTERSVSFEDENQKKMMPEMPGTTQGDHTTQPTVMTRYTHGDMQLPSS